MKRFEDKPCVIFSRGTNFPIKANILRNHEEINFFRDYSIWEFELPWFTIIVVDNF